MEYSEEDFLNLSGIQHFLFCRRQWALIHIEQQWAENLRTTEGEILHKKAHDPYKSEKRKNVIITRGMPVFSRVMGISGICDIVEFYEAAEGIHLHGRNAKYTIHPVEYKRGKPKTTDMDILQLTAQAMCLEEMLCCEIENGSLYYGEIRRREEVQFTKERKDEVRNSFAEMHELYNKRYTPLAKQTKGCNACSLKDICLPRMARAGTVRAYIKQHVSEKEEQ